MENAIRETERRRGIQQAYNEAHGITPQTIVKDVHAVLEISGKEKRETTDKAFRRLSAAQRHQLIDELTREMRAAASLLEFERAAELRDKIEQLKKVK
jgi:excinuclease ABC subunit B